MSVNKSIKAVIFDFDDTLFDHEHSSREGLRAVWKRYSCFQDIDLKSLEAEHSEQLEKIHFNYVLFGKMTIEEARIERFKNLFLNRKVEVDFETANNAADIYRMSYQKHRRCCDGAEELLKIFSRKFKIGIVTNNLISEQEEKLKFLRIEKYINAMVTSEEAKMRKPHRFIFDYTLQKLNVNNDEAVMIGDSWEADIVGAHSAGIKCIWYNYRKTAIPDINLAKEIRTLKNPEYIESLFYSTN